MKNLHIVVLSFISLLSFTGCSGGSAGPKALAAIDQEYAAVLSSHRMVENEFTVQELRHFVSQFESLGQQHADVAQVAMERAKPLQERLTTKIKRGVTQNFRELHAALRKHNLLDAKNDLSLPVKALLADGSLNALPPAIDGEDYANFTVQDYMKITTKSGVVVEVRL